MYTCNLITHTFFPKLSNFLIFIWTFFKSRNFNFRSILYKNLLLLLIFCHLQSLRFLPWNLSFELWFFRRFNKTGFYYILIYIFCFNHLFLNSFRLWKAFFGHLFVLYRVMCFSLVANLLKSLIKAIGFLKICFLVINI